MPTSRFYLTTLGRLSLTDDAGADDPSLSTRPRKLALLAWLMLRPGRRATRDRILGVFWGDRDESRARNSLADAVSHLRRVLGREAVETRANEVAVPENAPLRVDALELADAASRQDHAGVVALYHGPFLDGFYISDSAEFDDWRDRERARLARLFAASAAKRCNELAAGESWTECRSLAERWLDAEAASTEAASMLLRATAAPATRAAYVDVVNTYQALVRRLDNEIGIAPDAAVVALAKDAADRLAEMPAPDPIEVRAATASSNSPRSSRMRRWTAIAVAATLILAIIGVAAMRRTPRLDAHRVIVTVLENRTGDTAFAALGAVAADWISRGLMDTHAVEVVDPLLSGKQQPSPDPRAIGRDSRAGTVIVGSYTRNGDSIVMGARIVGANSGRVLRSTQPAAAPIATPLVAVGLLRQRLAGEMAAEVDPVLAGLAKHSAQPPTYDAYMAWIEGLDLFSKTDYRAAIPVLLRASSLDSSFVTPAIWAMAAYGNMSQYRVVDSIAQTLMPRREAMTRYDRGLFDVWVSRTHGDLQGQYTAAHDMLAAAPGFEGSVFMVGSTALYMNRLDEAADFLERIPVERSAALWDAFGTQLALAYHLADRHDDELRETARRLSHQPTLLGAMEERARALIGAGRIREALEFIDQIVQTGRAPARLPVTAVFNLGDEMLRHGHPDEARQLFQQARTLVTAIPDDKVQSGGARLVLPMAELRLGNLAAADSIALAGLATAPNDISYLRIHGIAAARRGEVAEADSVSSRLAALHTAYMRGANTYAEAQIAAVLGRKAEAVRLLKQANREGLSFTNFHVLPELLPLRGYSPFDAFIAPVR